MDVLLFFLFFFDVAPIDRAFNFFGFYLPSRCRVFLVIFFFLFPLVLSTHRSTTIIQVFAVCWWHDVCIAKHLLLNKNLFGICASFFTHILPCLLTSWVNVKISALFVLCIFFFDSLCAFWIFVFIYLY